MAPPRRGRGSSKRGSMPSSRRALRAAAASSSSRRIPDIEDAQPIPDAAADELELDALRAAARWFPTVNDRVEYPRRGAPRDANNGGSEEIVSVHSSDEADNEDGSDHELPQDVPRQQPRAVEANNGQPGPSRKRQASVTLNGPVDTYLKQGPAASPSRPPAVPIPSTQIRAGPTVARPGVPISAHPRSGMPNAANDHVHAPVNHISRELDGINRQIMHFTSASEHLLSTGSSLRLDMAQQNGLIKEIKSLRARYDDLKAKHKTLGDDHRMLDTQHKKLVNDHRVLESKHKTLGDDFRTLTTRHKHLGDDHRVLGYKHKTLGDDFRALTTKHTKLATDHRVLDASLDELKKQNDQLKKENEALRRQHFRDLKDAQIAYSQRKEAEDAAKRRIQQLHQDVADRVLEIDIYEEIFIEEGDRDRARFMANEDREQLDEESESESESESEEEMEEELELED